MAGDGEAGWVDLTEENQILVGIDFIDMVKKMPRTRVLSVVKIDGSPNRYQVSIRGSHSVLFDIEDEQHILLLGYRGDDGITKILADLDAALQLASSIGSFVSAAESGSSGEPTRDPGLVKALQELGAEDSSSVVLSLGSARYQITIKPDILVVAMVEGDSYIVQGYKVTEDGLEGSLCRIRKALGLAQD